MWNLTYQKQVEQYLKNSGIDFECSEFFSIGGGCINTCYGIVSPKKEKLFLKINTLKHLDNFQKEKANLEYLKNKSLLKVPDVIGLFHDHTNAYLILEYLEKLPMTTEFYYSFGKGLATLHQHTENFFGWFEDNYIGNLPQKNQKHSKWSEFFVTQRLEPLVKVCYDKKIIEKKELRAFQNLYNQLETIFPEEPPALLHGDLWQGNIMNSTLGACIFDAACYFGHREMDIAMSMLFGNLPPPFFDGYNEVYPIEKNFLERKDICNLYPLLVHTILFGMSYVYDIKNIIKKFQ